MTTKPYDVLITTEDGKQGLRKVYAGSPAMALYVAIAPFNNWVEKIKDRVVSAKIVPVGSVPDCIITPEGQEIKIEPVLHRRPKRLSNELPVFKRQR